MSLNNTPSSERIHIGFFGQRNAGKSSLVNAVTNQNMSLVSSFAGTTTDPVKKAMELLPLGPVVIIDTPGFDDEGALGEMRVAKTKQILNTTDAAVLVIDSTVGKTEYDEQLISIFEKKSVPYLVVYNKCDLSNSTASDGIFVSAEKGINIDELKNKISLLIKTENPKKQIVGDILKENDIAVLVTPIDSAAPKGRLILPQQQVIRDILECGALNIVVRETELKAALASLSRKPSIVITDSQAFERVSEETPNDILLTSFSILMARYKGFLEDSVKGAIAIDKLKNGDKVLICEGCTHHRQCDDIGTVKLPKLLKKYTGKDLIIENTSGKAFPDDLSEYSLIIHCGGCMLTEREVNYRRKCALDAGIPFTNYGISIAFMHSILKRSLEVFPDIADLK